MRPNGFPSSRTLAGLSLSALALAAVVAVPRAADVVPAHPGRQGAPTARSADAPPATAPNPQVAQLDQQIKAMREEYHSQLDPLQAQVRALHDKYDPQLKALEEQRYSLAEQGKSPEMQQLDSREKSDLAALADREKADLDGVRQKYAQERKDIQQKYADQRKELQARH